MMIICANCGKHHAVPADHNPNANFWCDGCGLELTPPPGGAHDFNRESDAAQSKEVQNRRRLRAAFGSVLVAGIGVMSFGFVSLSAQKTHPASAAPIPATTASETMALPMETSASDPTQVVFVQKPLARHKPFSLPNGTELVKNRDRTGRGSITITNDGDKDAVVKLIVPATDAESAHTYCAVFVRAKQTAPLSHIQPATYDIRFCSGRDWSKPTQAFLADKEYSRFDTPFVFEEKTIVTEDSERTTFSKYSVSLTQTANATDGGTAHTYEAAPDEFDLPGEAQPPRLATM